MKKEMMKMESKKMENVQGRFTLLKVISFFILLIFGFSSVYSVDYINNQEKKEIYDVVDLYYFYFLTQDLDNYLSTQYLKDLSDSELKAKKEFIKSIWSKYTAGYSINEDIDNLDITKDGDLAIFNYDLTSSVFDLSGEKTLQNNEMKMTAILIKNNDTNNEWKIIDIVPTSVYKMNLLMDLSSSEGIEEEKYEENETILDVENKTTNLTEDKKNDLCYVDLKLFDKLNNFSVKKFSWASAVIGNDKIIDLKIRINKTNSIKDFYLRYKNDYINLVDDKDSDYIIKVDDCTIHRIINGGDPKKEFDDGNIVLESNKIISKIKITIMYLLNSIYSWFS